MDRLLDSDSTPADVAKNLIGDSDELLPEIRDRKTRAAAEVLDEWRADLDRLEVLIEFSAHLRMRFTGEVLVPKLEEGVKGSRLLLALAHLAHRAALCSEEILLLLKGGFATGAFARWRTLYELTVPAVFLSRHSDEEAEAWLDHDAMQGRSFAKSLKHFERSEGVAVLAASETDEIYAAEDEMRRRYGPEFRGQHGWAHAALLREDKGYEREWSAGKRKAGPFLSDLTSNQELSGHTYYRLASSVTHGGDSSWLMGDQELIDQGVHELVAGPTAEGIRFVIPSVASTLVATVGSYVLAAGDLDPEFHKALDVSVELRKLVVG